MVQGTQAGALSIVPALVAIGLAWYTRDALIGLFVGVVTAAVVYGALNPTYVGVPADLISAGPQMAAVDPQTADADSWTVNLGGVLLGVVFGLKVAPEIIATAPLFGAWYVENVLLAIFAIGGMIGLMIRSGAIQGVLEALAARVDSPADSEKAAFLAGIAIHIDDYFNCLVVGSMMRPLTDQFNVSRAKLAVRVDTAGVPRSCCSVTVASAQSRTAGSSVSTYTASMPVSGSYPPMPTRSSKITSRTSGKSVFTQSVKRSLSRTVRYSSGYDARSRSSTAGVTMNSAASPSRIRSERISKLTGELTTASNPRSRVVRRRSTATTPRVRAPENPSRSHVPCDALIP